MCESLKVQLSPRIEKHCLKLWQDEHYKHAAREAMIQVELALKEKGMVINKRFGKTLINSLFTPGQEFKNVKLRVPLSDQLQDQAKDYFGAVFAYYRNYLAHNSSNVDKNTALRVLVIASELLDLIDASSLNYEDLGGLDGLLNSGIFDTEDQLLGILKTCKGYALLDHDASGLRDNLFSEYGISEQQLDAVFELDLVRYIDTEFSISEYEVVEGGWLELTEVGKEFLDEINKRKLSN
jgi:uncharacterized protein (TIGR02391 family)